MQMSRFSYDWNWKICSLKTPAGITAVPNVSILIELIADYINQFAR